MADFFQGGRGCVYTPNNSGGGGWYRLEGLSGSSGGTPILILGAQSTDADLIFPVTALGNIQIVYTLGRRFGNIQILGTVLAGQSSSGGGGVGAVISYFETNRVSESQNPVNLSVPGGRGYKVYLTGFGLAEPDAEFNIQPFLFHGIIASPK